MSAPWMKFYPRDWRGDQSLRIVSLAARGLWIECISIMHEAKPYGHLVMNGHAVGDDALSRLVGAPVDEVRRLLDELQKAGVLSANGKGVIFSRRMVRDAGRAKKGRDAAKKRWGQPPDYKEENDKPNRSPNGNPITQKPEARSQKEEAKASLAREAHPPNDDLVLVMQAAGMTRPPRDAHLLQQWMAGGARMNDHILPVARRLGEREAERGKPIMRLLYLDGAVKEAVDEERREIEHYREIQRRYPPVPASAA